MALEGLVKQNYLQMFSIILYETMCSFFDFFICFSAPRKINMRNKLTWSFFLAKW